MDWMNNLYIRTVGPDAFYLSFDDD